MSTAESYFIGLNSLLLSSYRVLTACRVQFLLSKPCQLKNFQNIWRESCRWPCACGSKQHPQIQFQTQSHYLYYTSLKAQWPPQAYLRVKEKQPLAYHSKFISLVPACCSSLQYVIMLRKNNQVLHHLENSECVSFWYWYFLIRCNTIDHFLVCSQWNLP